MRGCLLLLLGFVAGAGLMLWWWPQQAHGIVRPQAADLQVTISDGYLSRAIQQRLGGLTLPSVKNVAVRSVPHRSLLVGLDLAAGPVSAPVSIEVQPVAANGTIDLRVISTRVAGIPIPAQITGLVSTAINDSTRVHLRANTRVTGVDVTATGLEVLATDAP